MKKSDFLKLNNSDEFEQLDVITLSKDRYPIAFQAKVDELVEEEGVSEEEAEAMVEEMEFQLELYYHKSYGLFAVECDAVESGTIYSPYSGEQYKDADAE